MSWLKRTKLLGVSGTLILDKIRESMGSVLPVGLIVLILSATVTPIENGVFLAFLLGYICVTVGMGLFTLGADTGMTSIGKYVSATVIKSKKIWLIMPIFFVVGVLITLSEPDLSVLIKQVGNTVNNLIIALAIGVGVGVFLVFAFLRIVVKVKLKLILLLSYIAVFMLLFFVPKNFVPLAFDASGVTTGPMSVPFIIAMGTGVVYLRSDDGAEDDGFGLTALCSVGPIIAVMIMGIIYRPAFIAIESGESLTVADSKELFSEFYTRFPKYITEVGLALLPIVGTYFLTMIFGSKVAKSELLRTVVGVLYAYVGLVVFLLGVNCGFLPIGNAIGRKLGGSEYAFIAIPIGMLLGFFTAGAEPAVHVLGDQVYIITEGAIPKGALRLSLMAGVSFSIALSFLRIYFSIPVLWFLIPVYAIALIMTFIVPDIFSAIAFDSGGVASGAMSVGFLSPMAIGFCEALGKDVGNFGLGLVAFVSMTPLVAVQILGLLYKMKNAQAKKKVKEEDLSEDIID